MSKRQIFDSSIEGQRRSVLFALSLTTALISIFAATATYLSSTGNISVVTTLLAIGLLFVAFAILVYAGQLSGLFADEQLFWAVLDLEE